MSMVALYGSLRKEQTTFDLSKVVLPSGSVDPGRITMSGWMTNL